MGSFPLVSLENRPQEGYLPQEQTHPSRYTFENKKSKPTIYPRLPKAIKRMVEVARLFFAERPFLRLALNIQEIMVFVATVTPPSSSQLQMTAPKPLIPRLANCMVTSLFTIARCPAHRICAHRFFHVGTEVRLFKNAANLVASGHRCRSGMRCGLLGVWLSTLVNVLSTLLNVLSTLKNVLSMVCPCFVHASFSFEID